jgi:two-component system sensor histidine kinase CpxA
MHRLFYKIFLWFWLGIVVVGITLVALTALTHSRSSEDEHWSRKYEPRVDLWARQETEILDREGPSALKKYVDTFESDPGVQNYIFDASGQEMLARQVPPRVLQIVTLVSQSSGANTRLFRNERIIAEKVVGQSGQGYVVIVSFPQPSVLRRRLFQFLIEDLGRAEIIRLGAVLVVAGLFCFWLARQITNPIGKLRLATHEIANEHLDARVDKNVLSRRDELAELGRDFDHMAERIAALVIAQRRLLADVSHTLRSPLSRVSVAVGLARQSANPETSEHLDWIERETDRLNTLIGQLLTLSRAESGVDLQQKKILDLGILVQEVAADGDYEARNRNRAVVFSSPPECLIEGVPELLRSAVENVVRNAVRHTAEGTDVEITVKCRRAEGKSQAVVQVRDHGTGVPEDELLNLFRRFHRGINDARQDPDGTGLGLAITECAFRLHGGRVEAANAPGGGLVVTLELPGLDSNTNLQFDQESNSPGDNVPLIYSDSASTVSTGEKQLNRRYQDCHRES